MLTCNRLITSTMEFMFDGLNVYPPLPPLPVREEMLSMLLMSHIIPNTVDRNRIRPQHDHLLSCSHINRLPGCRQFQPHYFPGGGSG